MAIGSKQVNTWSALPLFRGDNRDLRGTGRDFRGNRPLTSTVLSHCDTESELGAASVFQHLGLIAPLSYQAFNPISDPPAGSFGVGGVLRDHHLLLFPRCCVCVCDCVCARRCVGTAFSVVLQDVPQDLDITWTASSKSRIRMSGCSSHGEPVGTAAAVHLFSKLLVCNDVRVPLYPIFCLILFRQCCSVQSSAWRHMWLYIDFLCTFMSNAYCISKEKSSNLLC